MGTSELVAFKIVGKLGNSITGVDVICLVFFDGLLTLPLRICALALDGPVRIFLAVLPPGRTYATVGAGGGGG